MIDQIRYSTRWWAWWSNPLIGLHPDHHLELGLGQTQPDGLNYFELMELRSKLELPDLPDDSIQARPELTALSMCDQNALIPKLQFLSVLTLDYSIRHARAQDWEEIHGVRSAETIREIVTHFNNLPTCLMTWQDNSARAISQYCREPILLSDRILVVLASYLKSVTPRFFSRWRLTQSSRIHTLIQLTEQFSEETWDELDQMIRPVLQAVRAEQEKAFEIQEFFMDEEEPFEELTMESILGEDHA